MRAAVVLGMLAMAFIALTQRTGQAATDGSAWAGGLDADPGPLPGYGWAGLGEWWNAAEPMPAADLHMTPAPVFDLGFDAWALLGQQADRAEAVKASTTDPDAANVRAFLRAIATAEGTERAADPYRVCYGYRHTIQSFADHPAASGEWAGEPLDNLGPRYVGKRSTAAGRYQIIRPTWERCRRALGLQDFSPASQDAAAVYLIQQRRALQLVQFGQIQRAAALCASEWASLPGSTAGQPTVSMAAILDTYTSSGGNLA